MFRIISLSICSVLLAGVVSAEDWPVYQHDNRRSGITKESLTLPLEPSWTYAAKGAPQTAWEGPAKWDAYSGNTELKSMRNFDPAFFVTVEGDRVFFGSSVDDAAYCVNAKTGETVWRYFAEGPVRLPPSLYHGKAYFGSDDGYAYCVDAKTGALVWRYKAAEDDRFIPANGKLLSHWPVRTGVVVQDGVAYFGASLLPWEPSYLCGVNAVTGAGDDAPVFKQELENVVLQGSMLASKEQLYVLQGRSNPVVFSLEDGRRKGVVDGAGGAFALLTEDAHFISNFESQKEDRVGEAGGVRHRDQLATYEEATRIVVQRGIAYLQSPDQLSKFERAKYLETHAKINELRKEEEKLDAKLKQIEYNVFTLDGRVWSDALKKAKKEIKALTGQLPESFVWRMDFPYNHALILAGKMLFAGGMGKVAAVDTENGAVLWEGAVEGVAHGLAVANGALYVSTDRGRIHRFVPADSESLASAG